MLVSCDCFVLIFNLLFRFLVGLRFLCLLVFILDFCICLICLCYLITLSYGICVFIAACCVFWVVHGLWFVCVWGLLYWLFVGLLFALGCWLVILGYVLFDCIDLWTWFTCVRVGGFELDCLLCCWVCLLFACAYFCINSYVTWLLSVWFWYY